MMISINPNSAAAWVMAAALVVNVSPTLAQEETSMEHMNHVTKPETPDTQAPEMDFSGKDMEDMAQPMDHSSMEHSMGQTMDHGSSGSMSGRMQGGSAPADARDPHAYSDGYDFGPIPRPRLADEHNFAALLVDRLETVRGDDNTWTTYDLQAWYGRDYDRVVLKAEGDVDNGKLEEGSTELLWGHAIATFWNTQLGLRYDSGEGPDRSWVALGVQGLAPYWFELDATAYLGENGHSALGIEAEYELLLTQRVILQPRLEAMFYGKDDAERTLGSGLSDMTAGLRLRYQIRREFAPYVGIERAGKFGATADYASAAGQAKDDTRLVAGLRFWF